MIRRHLALAAFAAVVAGCAAPPPLCPAPQVETVYVPVEKKSDAKMPEVPRFAVDALPIGGPPAEKLRQCFVERDQRRAYEKELVGELGKCR